jgi:hypothetical protein
MSENFEQAMVNDFNGLQKPQTPQEREEVQKQEEKKVIDRIIRGVNDVFVKNYNFEDFDMKFTIKLRAPNALEVGQIQAKTSLYLNGMNNYSSEYMIVVFQTLATLRITGIDVPKELAKDEEIYNLDVLYQIGRDFQQWLNTFRR